MIVAFLALYIWQVNVIIGNTYLRDSLLQKTEELKIRSAELSIAHSQAGSLNGFGDLPGLSSFEQAGKIIYIKIFNGVVVRTNEELAP